jgi:hypothetical protein
VLGRYFFLRFLEEHLVDRHACVGTSRDELYNLVGCSLRVRCLPEKRDAVGEPRIVILGLRQDRLRTARCKSELCWGRSACAINSLAGLGSWPLQNIPE